jgi:hypothetical protein
MAMMKKLLALVVLVSVLHLAASECRNDFQFGLRDRSTSAVEGGVSMICIIAKCGNAPDDIEIDVIVSTPGMSQSSPQYLHP